MRYGRTYKTLLIIATTLIVWLAVFVSHGYVHVSNLTGQCCGYEGDPAFLALFFLIYPGIYYFLGLFVAIGVELLVIRSRSTAE